MIPLARIIVIGGIGILAYRAIAAAAAGAIGVDYARFVVGSYIIFAIAGYLAGRAGPLWWGAVAGAAIAGVEALAGWRLAAAVGPQSVRLVLEEARTGRSWTSLVLLVMVAGAILGVTGAAIAWWRGGRFGRTPSATEAGRRA
jgi:hypothetical protein